MSTTRRLERLGLQHLKDRPKELSQAIDEELARYAEEVKAWKRERPKPAMQGGPKRDNDK